VSTRTTSLVLVSSVVILLSRTPSAAVTTSTQPGPASFERVNVCERVPGEAVATAVSGKLIDVRPVNTSGMTAARCVYGITIEGTRRAFVLWVSPSNEYEGLRQAADGPVTPVSGVGDAAHQTFDAETKRYWLRAMKAGKATVQVSGERPEQVRAIALLALGKL
jgi:hypothetical protein